MDCDNSDQESDRDSNYEYSVSENSDDSSDDKSLTSIQIWKFEDAPFKYKKIASRDDSTEEWLVYVPPKYSLEDLSFLTDGHYSFGSCTTNIKLKNNAILIVGYHETNN